MQPRTGVFPGCGSVVAKSGPIAPRIAAGAGPAEQRQAPSGARTPQIWCVDGSMAYRMSSMTNIGLWMSTISVDNPAVPSPTHSAHKVSPESRTGALSFWTRLQILPNRLPPWVPRGLSAYCHRTSLLEIECASLSAKRRQAILRFDLGPVAYPASTSFDIRRPALPLKGRPGLNDSHRSLEAKRLERCMRGLARTRSVIAFPKLPVAECGSGKGFRGPL